MNFSKYFQQNTKESNIRLNVTMMIFSLCIILVAVAGRIIADVIKSQSTSWWDMGLFVGAVCSGGALILYQKVIQKKIETKESKDNVE